MASIKPPVINDNYPDPLGLLMQKAQGGDAVAYRTLLNTISPLIKSYLRTRLFSRNHIDDIAQEILLAIHAVRHTYNPEQPFRNWMYGISRHKAIDYMRKAGRQNANETNDVEFETFMADGANNPEETLEAKQLRASLDRLPDKQRQILLLTKVEGFSMAEAGKKLGMTEAAAKVAAHRAYKKLKEILIDAGY
jgi:RNA polymerase sigma-70 factor (ECF subfamily)